MQVFVYDKNWNKVTTQDITFKDKIKRGVRYRCMNILCSNEMTYVNNHKRIINKMEVNVEPHFRHIKKSDCIATEKYKKNSQNSDILSEFVQSWLAICIKNSKLILQKSKTSNKLSHIANEKVLWWIRKKQVTPGIFNNITILEKENKCNIILARETRDYDLYNINNEIIINFPRKNSEFENFEIINIQVFYDNGTDTIVELLRDKDNKLSCNEYGFYCKLHDKIKFIKDNFNVTVENITVHKYEIRTIYEHPITISKYCESLTHKYNFENEHIIERLHESLCASARETEEKPIYNEILNYTMLTDNNIINGLCMNFEGKYSICIGNILRELINKVKTIFTNQNYLIMNNLIRDNNIIIILRKLQSINCDVNNVSYNLLKWFIFTALDRMSVSSILAKSINYKYDDSYTKISEICNKILKKNNQTQYDVNYLLILYFDHIFNIYIENYQVIYSDELIKIIDKMMDCITKMQVKCQDIYILSTLATFVAIDKLFLKNFKKDHPYRIRYILKTITDDYNKYNIYYIHLDRVNELLDPYNLKINDINNHINKIKINTKACGLGYYYILRKFCKFENTIKKFINTCKATKRKTIIGFDSTIDKILSNNMTIVKFLCDSSQLSQTMQIIKYVDLKLKLAITIVTTNASRRDQLKLILSENKVTHVNIVAKEDFKHNQGITNNIIIIENFESYDIKSFYKLIKYSSPNNQIVMYHNTNIIKKFNIALCCDYMCDSEYDILTVNNSEISDHSDIIKEKIINIDKDSMHDFNTSYDNFIIDDLTIGNIMKYIKEHWGNDTMVISNMQKGDFSVQNLNSLINVHVKTHPLKYLFNDSDFEDEDDDCSDDDCSDDDNSDDDNKNNVNINNNSNCDKNNVDNFKNCENEKISETLVELPKQLISSATHINFGYDVKDMTARNKIICKKRFTIDGTEIHNDTLFNVIDEFSIKHCGNTIPTSDDTIKICKQDLHNFKIANATTIYNSICYRWNTVIVVLQTNGYPLDKAILHTAITRAKNRCVILCDKKNYKLLNDCHKPMMSFMICPKRYHKAQ